MDWNKLQQERGNWEAANFKSQPAYYAALGIAEEAGELCRAVLKHGQTLLNGPEERYKDKDWKVEACDCVGDISIFAMSLCDAHGILFSRVLATGFMARQPFPMESPSSAYALGRIVNSASWVLNHAALGIAPSDIEDTLRVLFSELRTWCVMVGIDYEACVEQTWKEVSQRART